MKAEKQPQKQISHTLQLSKHFNNKDFIDNRSAFIAQTKRIKEINTTSPIQRVVLTRSLQKVVDNTIFVSDDDIGIFKKIFGSVHGEEIINEMISRILGKEDRSTSDDPGNEDDEFGANITYHGDLNEYDDPNEIDRDVEDVTQMARKGNTVSGPKTYKGTFGTYTNIKYTTDPRGGIDFSQRTGGIWPKTPVISDSLVDLPATINTKNRAEHFALADKAYANKKHWTKASDATNFRKGKYTWHHMPNPYNMVLVDMAVHAKHGHNGGVYLW